MMLPAAALAAQITDFGDGRKEAYANPAPFPGDTVYLTVPAECHVRRVSLNITTAQYDPASTLYPESVRVRFEDTVLYEFCTTGFGAFGRQGSFSDGSGSFKAAFPREGGVNSTTIRIPKRAVLENATFEVECSGGAKLVELLNLTPGVSPSTFGDSVASAGDLDGDGTNDLIVGDPYYSGQGAYTGRATIFFGCADLSGARTLNLSDGGQNSMFGSSVAGAGDVNGDGFDDVIVGALGYMHGGDYYSGAAFVYLGGADMDGVPDLAVYGRQYYGEMGFSVSGAGDLNGDGYDDFLIGEPYNNSGGLYRGAAYVHHGGKVLDETPELVLRGNNNYEYLGVSVAGAGDLNGDGRPDIAVGAVGAAPAGAGSGEVRVLFGGPNMDNATDLCIGGPSAGGYFGNDVSPAGDVNGDGYDDLVVGAYLNSSKGTYTGAAYLFLGGKSMDSSEDLALAGEGANEQFGCSVAGGFDINHDGYDDLAVGAPWDSDTATYAGRAYVFFGGPAINLTADASLARGATYELFGSCVAGGDDLNGDGRDEFLAGAPGWGTMGGGGKVAVYSTVEGVLDPKVEVAGGAALSLPGYMNRTFSTLDMSASINGHLQKQFPSGWDGFGNHYCDVPLKVLARSEGTVVIRPLNVTYSYTVALPDFSEQLNAWIGAHRKEADERGNLQMPLTVESATPGSVRFTGLNLTIDEAPRLVRPVPDASLDEDSFQNDLIDLAAFFEDDFDTAGQLAFSVVSSTFNDTVAVTINNGRWLSADALEGDRNDNWTGTVSVVVRAEDHFGSGRSSNEFNITVRNVNDPPVITSTPALAASGGDEWVYRLLADDGDRDRLGFRLAVSPEGMAINASTGVITWIPQKWGRYPVAASASDGTETAWQNFTLTVANRPPSLSTVPPAQAFIGQLFQYQVAASDPDGDPLRFALTTGLEGFSIDALSGLVTGVPRVLGNHELTVTVSDGRAEASLDFNLTVAWPNRSPYVTTTPVTGATEGLPYSYDIRAYDGDKDPLEFSLLSGPSWLSIDAASGRLAGVPEAAGSVAVAVLVRDGRGGEGRQEFTILVAPSVPPSVTFSPPDGKLRGAAELSGSVGRGTRGVVRVEVRVDGGQWREATFNGTWNLTLETGRLRDGAHLVEVRAYDGREYSRTVNGTIEVDNSAVVQAGGLGAISPVLLLGAVAAAVIAAAGAVVALRKRR
jgi:hypothetical protein